MSNLVTTIYSLLFTVVLANSSSASKADKLPSPPIPPFLQDFFSSNPIFAWIFWLFSAIAIGVAALAVFTGNLQKIIDFVKKNFSRTKVGVDDEELLKFRKQLLDRLENDISTRQKNSLHKLIQIDLAMEEQRRQVGQSEVILAPEDQTSENNNLLNRFVRIFRHRNSPDTQLESTQKTAEFYDRDDIQGKLLILGEPGAGKTTELLRLTQDLIQRAIIDDNAAIPVIFELSSWKNDKSIRDWLIEQLPKIYRGLPKAVAENWINNQQLIPLLDGLDELGSKLMEECILAINKFLENSSFQPGLVVCCRREEYEQAQSKLNQLQGAIYLSPLSDDQIKQYLKKLNRSSIWQETIVNEPNLKKLVSKPLFLTMLVVAYQGRTIKNSSELFEAYIEKQLNNPDSQGTYPPHKSPSQKQTLHYLAWLARKLEAERETEFLIEGMQPAWLESKKQKIFYKVLLGLIGGLILGLIGGPVGIFIGVLIGGLISGSLSGLITVLIGGLITGLIEGSIIWLIGGLIFSLILGNRNIESLDRLKFSINQLNKIFFINSLIKGLIGGLIIGLIFGLIFELRAKLFGDLIEAMTLMLVGGLILGLIFGLILGLIGGLISLEIKTKNVPNQGIINSWKNGLIIWLIFGLIFGLIVGLIIWLTGGLFVGLANGTLFGLILGLILGLIFGLSTVIQHVTLRLILYRNGDIPWNYARFLDHAAKHRFIQRVGGRYRFMHDLLRKHFAQMPLS